VRRENAVYRPAVTAIEHEHNATLAVATVGVRVGHTGAEMKRPVEQAIEHAVAAVEIEGAAIFANRNLRIAAPIVIAAAAVILRRRNAGRQDCYSGKRGREQLVFHSRSAPETRLAAMCLNFPRDKDWRRCAES
jgi:hypothetical protein